MVVQSNRRTGILIATAILLSIPLLAMQFSDKVHWQLPDFIIAGILILSTGLAIDFTITKVKKISYRIGICVALVIALLLFWAELAVGIFGSVFAGS